MDAPLSQLRTVSNRDGAVVLDVERGLISTLNPSGAMVWQSLLRGDAMEQIVTALAEQTRVERGVIECDVADFMQTLRDQGLLMDGE